MNGNGVTQGTDRRQILSLMLPAGAFACLYCRHAFAATADQAAGAAPPAKHKFQEPCGMSYEEVFKFAYVNGMIPVEKAMAVEMGRDKFLEMLKRASCTAAVQGVREQLQKDPKNDFATFAAEFHKPHPLYDHTLTYRIVEETPSTLAMEATECLWAKTFRDASAADIGYVSMCYPDIAAAPAFNPKMKLDLAKTLMQGHDRCSHRWSMEG